MTEYDTRALAANNQLMAAALAVGAALQRGDPPTRVQHYIEDVLKWARLLVEDLERPPWKDSNADVSWVRGQLPTRRIEVPAAPSEPRPEDMEFGL